MATAVWRGQLTFGLLTFPVKLYAAARRETISFRNLKKREAEEGLEAAPARQTSKQIALAPKQQAAPPELESRPEPVYSSAERVTHSSSMSAYAAAEPQPEVLKGYEFEKDRFVAIDPAEILKLARSTSRDLEVTEFVRWEEIDAVYLDTSYYVVPDPSGEKPYSLLYVAMKKTGFAALAQLAMHGREQVLVLRHGVKGLVGHTLFYASEVRRNQEAAAATENLNEKEIQLASSLIEKMAGPFEPERYIDSYKQRVQALVDAKVNSVPAEAATQDTAPMARKPPVDIMDALRRSLKRATERKAPQQQTPSPAARQKRKSA